MNQHNLVVLSFDHDESAVIVESCISRSHHLNIEERRQFGVSGDGVGTTAASSIPRTRVDVATTVLNSSGELVRGAKSRTPPTALASRHRALGIFG